MRIKKTEAPALPQLQPALNKYAAQPAAVAASTATADDTIFVGRPAPSPMSADTFEEDWQRPPGDIAYLQDILQSLDGHPQQQQHQPQQQQQQPQAGAARSAAASRREGAKAREEEDVVAVQMRERQIGVIERRRRRARCRCDAVESAFARSVERRIRAMQHLALDPPAERLVGQGTTQYVPAALLPEDVLDAEGRLRPGPLPLMPHSVVEAHLQQQQQQQLGGGPSTNGPRASNAQAVAAIIDGRHHRSDEPDALVFLTQLDAGEASDGEDRNHVSAGSGGPSRRAVAAAEVSSRGNQRASSHLQLASSSAHGTRRETFEEGAGVESEEEEEAWMRPSTLTDANKDRWRELGYHAVVVGDSAALSGTERATTRGKAHRQPPPPSSSSAVSMKRTADHTALHARGPTNGSSSWRWMPQASLPPVCLIQRRLPEEDMSATELRSRQPQTKQAPRRRPAAEGVEGRAWKMSDK